MKLKFLVFFILSISFIFIVSCRTDEKVIGEKSSNLTHIQLEGDLAERRLEASGLTWYKDNLIILPQFPHKWDDQFDGAIYFIPKERIESYLNGENRNPIKGEKILFAAEGLDEIGKRKGSGYEAITFIDDSVYLSIESVNGGESTSYIVSGVINFEERKITLNANSKIEVESQTGIHNMGEETILTYNASVFSIHEANGANVNELPTAAKLNENLKEKEKISFPNIEYRITDATSADTVGKFFAINYFFPGEFDKLKPNLSEEEKDYAIEQILEFQILDGKIIRTKKAPIVIQKGKSKKGSNWEGIVKLNEGFLMITDMFPETVLVYYK
ncbi:MAG: hypothetical protein L3J41_06265 [Melioribacteraceae bacterium]|nr:hypothetical protein [Melioribacteraceae bacterium]